MQDDSQIHSYFTKNLRQAQFDSALGAARYSNISRVEEPTPPILQVAIVFKRIGMVAVGGIAVGIGLAFLIELFIDQSIKRPGQLQKLLPLPVYLSLPAMRNGAPRRLLKDANSVSLSDRSAQRALPPPSSSLDERLQPYFEALRDRVLNRFETLARRPKLVGVCGSGQGTDSSTTAAGLAAALSEAGDLKVLLVEMANGKHRATPLASSRKSCNLLEALEGPNREEGMITPNLYRASLEGLTNGSAVTSPTRFPTMVPKLTASDYDYIIFDLPAVDQISITPRLAKHMDLTLLVVEAEKTHRNRVKQAGSLLLEFTPNVATVLSNTDAQLPRWLQQAL
jgi:Mrp family chromosome partitioning ATPase